MAGIGSLTDAWVTLGNGKKAIAVSGGGVGIDTFLQDQTSPIVDRFLTRKLGTATLAAPLEFEDRTILLEAGHGFEAEDMIEISEGELFYQSRVILVSVNTLTVTNPINCGFTVAAVVRRVSPDMNIDASASPIIFSQYPNDQIEWDVNVLAVHMLDATEMGDGTFGGLPALTNGVVFRAVNHNCNNIFTAIDNGCFIRHADTLNPYSAKPPAGLYGFNSKRYFNGQNGDGVAIRIGGEEVTEFQAVIADNLTGLDRFWCVIRGHVVEDR